VSPKKRPDVVPPDSQLAALDKSSQDEVEVTQITRHLLLRISALRNRARKLRLPNSFTSRTLQKPQSFGGSNYEYGRNFLQAISKLGVKSLELHAKAFLVCPCNRRFYNNLVRYREHCLNDS
jgi:hypothetical protein